MFQPFCITIALTRFESGILSLSLSPPHLDHHQQWPLSTRPEKWRRQTQRELELDIIQFLCSAFLSTSSIAFKYLSVSMVQYHILCRTLHSLQQSFSTNAKYTGSFRKNGKSKTFFTGTKFREKFIFSAFFSR